MQVTWNRNARNSFAAHWPCCDIPTSGWATFDDKNGDLVDISDNARRCEAGGGLNPFLDDLKMAQFLQTQP